MTTNSPEPLPPTPSTNISLLSSSNPLDYLRLLGWLFFAPQSLKTYQEKHGRYAVYRAGKWLAITLAWLPLFVVALGLAFNRLPSTTPAWSTTTYGWLCGGLLLAWGLTGWLADTEGDSAVVVAAGGVALAVVAGVALVAAFVMAGGLPIVLVLGIGVAMTIALAVGVVVVAIGVVVVAVGTAVGVILGQANIVAVVAVVVAIGVAVGVAFKVAGGLEKGVKNGRPNLITISAGLALILSYAFLIWFSFLGGAAALG